VCEGLCLEVRRTEHGDLDHEALRLGLSTLIFLYNIGHELARRTEQAWGKPVARWMTPRVAGRPRPPPIFNFDKGPDGRRRDRTSTAYPGAGARGRSRPRPPPPRSEPVSGVARAAPSE